MFGFKRREQERQAQIVQKQAVMFEAIRALVDKQLEENLAFIIRTKPLPKRNFDALIDRALKFESGRDAVLVNGLNAFGPELADAGKFVRGGATVSQACAKLSVLSGSVGSPHIRGDIFAVLGYERDGSGWRQGMEP